VTPSTEARNKLRLERAHEKGLTDHVKAAIDQATLSSSHESSGAPSFAAVSRRVGSDNPDGQEVLGSDATIDPAAQARLEKLDKQLGLTPCLILSVTENGYGKRTDVDQYRLQTRGGKGVINVKTAAKNGKVSGINLVDETSELMVISQFGKIIRIDTQSIRLAGRSTMGVKLLDLEDQDKVAAAVVIPPEEAKVQPEEGTLLQ
ncbi:MAG: DNA gyrase C-terminal beta-propeller domain-containing protein, partial [Granulicella sp.]